MWITLLLALALSLAGCSAESQDERTIVASVYPLAFLAEQVFEADVEIIELAPRGIEAHDLELTLQQRGAIEEADLVAYMGDIGFQPQVEAAAREATGEVMAMADKTQGLGLRPARDPHLWFHIDAMLETASEIWFSLPGKTAPGEDLQSLSDDLFELRRRFEKGLSPRACTFQTAIVTHEAFGYLASGYGFEQFGLSGITPEAEPTASRLAQARELIDSGEAGAVFYEEHDDAKRIAESFAEDAGVPALPLSTLESRPAEGDYLTVMEDNLESLREGLQCR